LKDAVLTAIQWVLSSLTKDTTHGIWHLFAQLFVSPLSIFKDDDVLQVQIFMTTLALGMLPVLIIIQSIRLAGARALGINSTPPEQLAHRAIVAGVACTSISTIVWVIITFGDNITQAFASFGLDLSVLEIMMNPSDSVGIGLLVVALFMVIGAILLTIQKAIISAELAVMLAFGPLTGLSLLKGSDDGFFNTWLRETASLILTPTVQLILTWLFLKKLAHLNSLTTSWDARLLTFGYFWVIWRCPAWLRKFMYSAGHGDMLVQGGAMVGRHVVMQKMLSAAAKTVTPAGGAG
jgi:hypothetical protein